MAAWEKRDRERENLTTCFLFFIRGGKRHLILIFFLWQSDAKRNGKAAAVETDLKTIDFLAVATTFIATPRKKIAVISHYVENIATIIR